MLARQTRVHCTFTMARQHTTGIIKTISAAHGIKKFKKSYTQCEPLTFIMLYEQDVCWCVYLFGNDRN